MRFIHMSVVTLRKKESRKWRDETRREGQLKGPGEIFALHKQRDWGLACEGPARSYTVRGT
jgi:hypothetical protein